jgi:long-subunit acyl-CoA synthetase (AMP-forming)
MKNIALALTIATALALAAPAFAQEQPVWALPTDSIAVVEIGTVNGLAYAKIRDTAMHGHNVFCITVGAHIGKATVTKISASGIQMSDGRVLHVNAVLAEAP